MTAVSDIDALAVGTGATLEQGGEKWKRKERKEAGASQMHLEWTRTVTNQKIIKSIKDSTGYHTQSALILVPLEIHI